MTASTDPNYPVGPERPHGRSSWDLAFDPDVDPRLIDEASLVDVGVACQVAQNRAAARQWDAILTYHDRMALEAEEAASQDRRRNGSVDEELDPQGRKARRLTPLKATKVEFCAALGVHELTVQIRLQEIAGLRTTFPGLWRRCLLGRLDLGRALIAVEQAEYLRDAEEVRLFADEVESWFDDRDRLADGGPGPDDGLCSVARQQVQRALYYRRLKRRQKDAETGFREAFERRAVRIRETEHGMAVVTATGSLPDAMAADYRLTLIAKKLAETDAQSRTLDQLRSDVLLDLIHGRLSVGATDRQLEDDTAGDEVIHRHDEVGGYARPVINVTVSIETLLGFSEEPGVLSGGQAIQADLARQIAADRTSTWYRMLTDDRRDCVELSTQRYEPTSPIWRQVVGRDQTCRYPGCCRPAARCEIDHTTPWPDGETSTDNLTALCSLHHQTKHSPGYSMTRDHDGTVTFTTRTGRRYTTRPPSQPGDGWPMAG